VAGEEHHRAISGRELRRRLHAVAVGSPAAQIASRRGAPNDRHRVGAAHRLATTSPPAAQMAARSADRDRS